MIMPKRPTFLVLAKLELGEPRVIEMFPLLSCKSVIPSIDEWAISLSAKD